MNETKTEVSTTRKERQKRPISSGLIADYLRRLTEEGGTHNFLVLGIDGHRYVQFSTSCGSATMYGEVSSGRYCTPGCTCGPNAAEQASLRALGWRPPTRRKFLNFHRDWTFITADDRRAIADTVIGTLQVFGWRDEPLEVNFHLDW